jgi:uncharacterized membrane protein
VADNVAAIAALEAAAIAQRTTSERLADRIVRTVGTPGFALLHAAWFAAWILASVGLVPGIPVFDPYPFGLLTLVVSLEAIFLTIFVLLSQNRLAREADRRSHLDLQINLLAEQESTRTVVLLQRISDHLGLPADSATEDPLATPTDLRHVAAALDHTLPAQ